MRIQKRLTIREDRDERTRYVNVNGLSDKTVDKLASIINVYSDGSFTADVSYRVWLLGGKIDTVSCFQLDDIRNELIRVLEDVDLLTK